MKYYRIIAISLTVLALVLAGSCEVTIYQLGDASGSVVDADTGAGIEGATVTLYQTGSTNIEEQAVTDASGNYNFKLVSVGVYDLVVSMTGMVFTSEQVAVAWDEESEALPTIAGFTPSSGTDLKIIALWDPAFADINAYLTVPNIAVIGNGDPAGSGGGIDANIYTYTINAVDHYDYYADTTADADFGFHPDTPGSIGVDDSATGDDRLMLFGGNSTITGLASMNEDDNGGPESISIHSAIDVSDWDVDDYYSTGANDFSRLTKEGYYDWSGVMEYYLVAVNSSNPNASSIDSSAALSSDNNLNMANPRIFIFDSQGIQKGMYKLPSSTFIHAASVLRINVFYHEDGEAYYQILPDIKVVMSAKNISDESPAQIVIPSNSNRIAK